MPTLLLIRHAEPEVTGVFLGQLDPRLSTAGRLHAAETLSGVEVAMAYSSPLQRARETAAFLRSQDILELACLREIDFGLWTGKAWEEIEMHWSDWAQRKSADWLGVAPPGGETWTDFLIRIHEAWQLIRDGPMPAAVVAHHGVNAALAQLITGQDPLEFVQHHGEVIRVNFD